MIEKEVDQPVTQTQGAPLKEVLKPRLFCYLASASVSFFQGSRLAVNTFSTVDQIFFHLVFIDRQLVKEKVFNGRWRTFIQAKT